MVGVFRDFVARNMRHASCVLDEARYYARSFFGPMPTRLDLLPAGAGGGSVLVLPGFLACDASTRPLRRGLKRMGYHVFKLGMGRNMGVSEQTLYDVDMRVRELVQRRGEPIILIGWSLGGLIAREYAKHAPELVRAVITLGSPIQGDLRTLPIARLYEWLAGHKVDAPPIDCALDEKPPQPTAAIWSPRDTVVPLAYARGNRRSCDFDIEVRCAHLGYCTDIDAMLAIDRAIARCCPEAASHKTAALLAYHGAEPIAAEAA
ncbi:MAG: alpha/beta hydrolase [Sphingomonas sp.]|nr:alpha/beta hydrolase [Sphingomonas sp.]